MPFTFISHANEDKGRIAPHLRRLMAHNLRLWVDRAHELGPEFDKQGRIATGESWPTSIDRALEEAGCVLVFWSTDALKKQKRVLRREAFTGLRKDKLIQVVLDREAKAELDEAFTDLQDESFYKLESEEEVDRACRRLAEAIRRKLLESARRRQLAEREVPPHLYPYVVDRQQQLARICNDLADHLPALQSAGSRVEQALRPVYVLFGCNEDCPERLSERLARVDGPEVCGASGRHEWLTWDDQLRLNWPQGREASPARLRDHIRLLLTRHAGRLDRPRCAISHIERVRLNEHEFLSVWLDSWNEHFAQAPHSPVIPLLTVNRSEGLLYGMSPARIGMSRLRAAIRTWPGGRDEASVAIAPVLLEDLSPISHFDAKGWADWLFGAGPNRAAADALVDVAFSQGTKSMRMDAFAKRVMATGWFQDIAGLRGRSTTEG